MFTQPPMIPLGKGDGELRSTAGIPLLTKEGLGEVARMSFPWHSPPYQGGARGG